MAAPILAVEGIRSGYRGNDVLLGCSLSLEKGAVCGVVGPNGAGKTTLLRSIFGLLALSEGNIRFDGGDISALPVRDRLQLGIACVPQERNVFSNLTVIENLEMSYAAIPRDFNLKQQVDLVFTLFPRLRGRQQQLAGTMSGGEQRMVAIGIGLMSKPRLLMLDEPTTGLAPQVVHQLMSAIRTMNAEHEITSIVVEQNILSLLKIVDVIDIVKDGKIRRYEGTPSTLAQENVWEFL
jgi:branched-chain amino acid transport system ATP-binding protein